MMAGRGIGTHAFDVNRLLI